jgi:hypothetical protein
LAFGQVGEKKIKVKTVTVSGCVLNALYNMVLFGDTLAYNSWGIGSCHKMLNHIWKVSTFTKPVTLFKALWFCRLVVDWLLEMWSPMRPDIEFG